MLYIGCPMWSQSVWKGTLFSSHTSSQTFLSQYASVFNSVEGNTTFYATPKPETIEMWASQIPESFQFTFKIHQSFTHECLLHCDTDQILEWLELFSALKNNIGSFIFQLPKRFSPADAERLFLHLEQFSNFKLSVEVRHPDFFDKGQHEIAFNRTLRDLGVERVIMDTRGVFAAKPESEAIIDAQQKKPRLPVHAVATTNSPIVRFVGHPDLTTNRDIYAPWLKKVSQWLSEGKTPYLFFHTPDNQFAPQLCRQFLQDLKVDHPILALWEGEKEHQMQGDLFSF